ncbi:AAA family ATPase [Aeromonas veronii]
METISPQKSQFIMERGAGSINFDYDQFLVEDLLDENSLAGFYGPSGSRKSFIIIDIACRIASGKKWQGREVKQGAVIYIAAEGSNGMKKRMHAWINKYNNGQDLDNLYRISQPIFVSQPPVVTDLILATENVKNETNMPVRLIVIDTLARSFIGNENSAEDMGKFIAGCDEIKYKTGATILIVHHTGKDLGQGARGAYSFKAALDSEYFITKIEGNGTITTKLECTKNKEGSDGLKMEINLQIEAIGKTTKGKTIDTLVVIDHDSRLVGAPSTIQDKNNQRPRKDKKTKEIVDENF